MSILFFLFFSFSISNVFPAPSIDITATPNLVGSTEIIFRVLLDGLTITKDSVFNAEILIPSEYTVSIKSNSVYTKCFYEKGVYKDQSTCTPANNSASFTGVQDGASQFIFYFGHYNHIGISNQTNDFEVTVTCGSTQYTFKKKANLVPKTLESKHFFC